MDFGNSPSRANRATIFVVVAAAHFVLAYGLLMSGAAIAPFSSGAPLVVSLLPEVPPAPPAPRETDAAPHREGASAPPHRRSVATELVAPVVIEPILPPPPIVTATVASIGAQSSSGAAPIDGPGSGAGGQGAGTGTGNGGAGDGGGGRGGSSLRQIGGRISGRDYPMAAFRQHIGGTVWVRYIVGIKGRVTDCAIARTSGNADLDATTCALIVQRFRFKPQRDAMGRNIPGIVIEDHRWEVDLPDYGIREELGSAPLNP